MSFKARNKTWRGFVSQNMKELPVPVTKVEFHAVKHFGTVCIEQSLLFYGFVHCERTRGVVGAGQLIYKRPCILVLAAEQRAEVPKPHGPIVRGRGDAQTVGSPAEPAI